MRLSRRRPGGSLRKAIILENPMSMRLSLVGGVVVFTIASVGCGGSDNDVFGASSAATTGATASGAGGSTAMGGGASSGGGGDQSGATTGQGGASSTGSGGSASTTATGSGGCASTTWFCDGDEDGHGDHNVAADACEAPPGGNDTCAGSFVASNDDCGPNDASAYPGQQQFFSLAAKPPIYDGPSYDYDCDGEATRDPEQLFKSDGVLACTAQDCLSFNPPQGFAADAACGSSQGHYQCAQPLGQPCFPELTDAPAPLRCR
jgi:hypothetical protein